MFRPHCFIITAALFFIGIPPLLSAQDRDATPAPRAGKQKPPAAARAPRSPGQETRRYRIPPTFLVPRQDSAKTSADPFSEKNTQAGSGAEQDLRMTFLKAGVELNTDDTLSYDTAVETLTVTTSVAAHRQFEEYFAQLKNAAERQIHILVEFIEVSHPDFSDWMLENRITGDGTPLRREVQTWIRREKATILNSVLVTARSGQRAKVESIHEHIYPTEFTPQAIPNTLTQAGKSEVPTTGISPTAFEQRNLGVTLEVDPVLGNDNLTIDLNLAPEMVQLEGFTTWPNEDVDPKYRAEVPVFYSMKTTTQVTTLDGRYALLSTLRPLESADPERPDALVLLFVRADVGSMGEWSVEATR